MSDLRERVPGHSLIDELLRQWDLGTIHVDVQSNGIVIDEEAEGWYRGVIGERRIAALLEQLGSREPRSPWTVLHSVPVGRNDSDIDHVVIGPPGVFTINTKFSPGRSVWVAGRNLNVERVPKPYILNALAEARRASHYLTSASGLTVPVTGLVVFVDPSKVIIKEPAGGGEGDPRVRVLRDTELLDELFQRREFSDEQVARIVDAAARPETWTDAARPSTAGQHISREFEALQQEVGPRLEQPRGQVRAIASRPYSGQSYSRGSRGPRRQYSGSGRSRRPKPTLLGRFLAGTLVIATCVFLYFFVTQVLPQLLVGALLP